MRPRQAALVPASSIVALELERFTRNTEAHHKKYKDPNLCFSLTNFFITLTLRKEKNNLILRWYIYLLFTLWPFNTDEVPVQRRLLRGRRSSGYVRDVAGQKNGADARARNAQEIR